MRSLLSSFLLLLSSGANALKLNCAYSYIDNCIINCHQCTVQKLIITKPNQNVTAINGYQDAEKMHEEVLTLRMIEQLVVHIPSGLHQHFAYLRVLKIWSSGLRFLEQKDIRDLKHLADLSLTGNRLETLNSDLFAFNHRIIKIDFTRNRLRHVGTYLLKPLHNVIVADFYQNDCISDGARYTIDELKLKLRKKCQPTTEMIIEEVDSLTSEIDYLKREIDRRDKKLKMCAEEQMPHEKLDSLFPMVFTGGQKWEDI